MQQPVFFWILKAWGLSTGVPQRARFRPCLNKDSPHLSISNILQKGFKQHIAPLGGPPTTQLKSAYGQSGQRPQVRQDNTGQCRFLAIQPLLKTPLPPGSHRSTQLTLRNSTSRESARILVEFTTNTDDNHNLSSLNPSIYSNYLFGASCASPC